MNSTLHPHEHAHPHRSTSLAEHARVRLREALPKYHLRAGAMGTVVHVYRHGGGLEVEFAAASDAPEIVTLARDLVEPVDD